ncbi:MAG: hypothetical protein WCY09_08010 [Candidatus Omnitrophota bacterium]|jgi:uncharacterized Zn finger protein (UPF0148 family)
MGNAKVFLIDVCDACGTADMPLKYFKRTGEYLCDPCRKVRILEPQAKRKIAREEKETDFFREMVSLPDKA